MPSYKVSFSKNLLSSDGHQFKCVQQTIAADAPNPQAAVEVAKRQFEQHWRIGDWRQHADEADVQEHRGLSDAYLTEIARLQEQLARTERRLASLQATRRLSDDEKNVLINALRPYAGQRVMIAAIAGDADGKAYAEDFVEVFDAAGWQRTALAFRHWDRDPVGVEVTLNEADGRAGRINTGVGALINIVRKLSLTDSNTIYLTAEVPSGEVQIKIGKKLPR